MASFIAHIVYGDRILGKYSGRWDRGAFLAGTVFPDIRKLAKISRATTHVYEMVWQQVFSEPDSFTAGMLLHSYQDQLRALYSSQAGLTRLGPNVGYIEEAVKCLEDELVYDWVSDWSEICNLVQSVRLPDNCVVSEQMFSDWYKIVTAYIANPPNDVSRALATKALLLPDAVADEINSTVAEMRHNQAVTKRIAGFKNYFEEATNGEVL